MKWDTQGGRPLKDFEHFYEWVEFVANDDFFDHVFFITTFIIRW